MARGDAKTATATGTAQTPTEDPKPRPKPKAKVRGKKAKAVAEEKAALPSRYTLRIEAEVNGHIRRATIYAHALDGSIKATDKANLADGAELCRAARRLAGKLDVNAAALEANLSQAWAETLDRHRREYEQAAAGSPEAAPEPPGSPCSPSSVYEERDHRIYRHRHSKDAGDYLEPLANFTARINREDVIDDGSGEVRHVFCVEGTLHNGIQLSETAVPSGDFGGMAWVAKGWGCRANPATGLAAKDHLRAAIQELSGDPPRRVIYQHTGWRSIGGAWHYLHAGGGIGAQGINPAVLVQLDSTLSRYHLPPPLEECWQSTLARQGKPNLCVDLTGVTFIDAAGKACLAALHRQGAEFIAADCLTKAVVDEITQAAFPTASARSAKADAGRDGIEVRHEDQGEGSPGLVRRLPGCSIGNLRVRRLALVPRGGRLGRGSRFTCRGAGPRRGCRHHVVSVSRPRRKAVARRAGSLRRTGTGEEDSLTEELSCSSAAASSVTE